MQKNVLIAFALGALLMGAGVVVGTQLEGDAPATPSAPPELLKADAPEAETKTEAPKLLGQPLDEQILMRLARLEERIEVLVEQQKKLSKDVEPAAWVAQMIKSRMPAMDSARLKANETAAHATLRNCISAQAQMQATGRVDADNDGTGEYAGFRELSGAVPGRMSRALIPPVLSSAFKTLTRHGEVGRTGYLFKVYLPGSRGEGIGEPPAGFTNASGIDSNLAETTWCMYAWPGDPSQGSRVYFINQAGDVLSTEDARYVGSGNGPEADAAFVDDGRITGKTAIGRKGNDGNVWKQRG
ncbi:MAG: hypothetical protein QNJ90_10185 [Planctomycetota bacterium]|nr:hypothetical protein [Planctomycetota bacterium]